MTKLWLKNKGALPFNDTRDFDEAENGFIAAPPYKQTLQDDGKIVWDMQSHEWLLN